MEKDYKKMYEDALEKAKQQLYIAECNKDEGKVWYLKYMFTELRDNEDERIRKELINFFSKGAEFDSSTNGIKDRNIIAWLERQCKQKSQGKSALEVWKDMRFEVYQQASGNRHEPNYSDDSTKMFSLTDIDEIFEKVAEKQGEQESTDKVKPKFNIGDWITNGECTWNVTDIHIQPLDYTLQSPNGVVIYDAISYVDEHFHLWTIQDAKDGDVLVYPDGVLSIFSYRLKGLDAGLYMAYVLLTDKIETKQTCAIKNVKLATKEQCDLLFQKMREAGYEWDFEKKELKKIEQESTCWSEEDERWFKELELMVLSFSNDDSYRKKFFEWLKSLKDKAQSQPKQEWSEDDEKMLSKLIKHFEWKDTEYRFTKEDCLEAINWLKSLEDIIHSQPKQWWSENDEQMFTQIINEMEAIKSNSSTIFEKNIAQEKIDWLKSIKHQQNQYDKGFNDGFSASEYNKILTEEDIRHIDNIIGCLEEFTRPGFPIYKGNVFKEIKWLEKLKNNK